MEMESLGTGGKVVGILAETGGAIGIICGLLLVGMSFFLRNLLQSLQTRDKEMFALNQELNKALVGNTAAMVSLAQLLQNRKCLATDTGIVDRISRVTNIRPSDVR